LAVLPSDELTCREIYDEIVATLRRLGASQVVDEIERTVARGVVLTGQQTKSFKESAVFRPMDDEESLAVALEFLVTAMEVPLMLDAASHKLGVARIDWKPERPGTEREDVAVDTMGQVDYGPLRELLSKVIEIAEKLGITLPDIA